MRPIFIWLLIHRVSFSISDKDRELGDAYAEIKALKYHEHLKEKAVEEVLLLFPIFHPIITIKFYCVVDDSYTSLGLRIFIYSVAAK